MKFITAPQLALQASGRLPKGLPATTAGVCVTCGGRHEVGDLVNPAEFKDTFTNYNDLTAPGSDVMCGYCYTVMESEPLPKLSDEEKEAKKAEKEAQKNSKVKVDKPLTNPDFTGVHATCCITKDGVYRFQKSIHVAYWLKNPPTTPFVMMMRDQMRMHMLFRTPVNYNNKVFTVRIGSKLATIRHTHLMEAEKACHQLSDMYMNYISTGPNKKKVPDGRKIYPFMHMDREMSMTIAGRIRPAFYEMANDVPEALPLLDVINNCTAGEVWGLSYLLTTKGEEPVAEKFEFLPFN